MSKKFLKNQNPLNLNWDLLVLSRLPRLARSAKKSKFTTAAAVAVKEVEVEALAEGVEALVAAAAVAPVVAVGVEALAEGVEALAEVAEVEEEVVLEDASRSLTMKILSSAKLIKV